MLMPGANASETETVRDPTLAPKMSSYSELVFGSFLVHRVRQLCGLRFQCTGLRFMMRPVHSRRSRQHGPRTVYDFPVIFLDTFFTLVGPQVESGSQQRKKHTNIKHIIVFQTFPYALSGHKPDQSTDHRRNMTCDAPREPRPWCTRKHREHCQ
jgi:hypothetical protein